MTGDDGKRVSCAMCGTTSDRASERCEACGLSLDAVEQEGVHARVRGTFTVPPPPVVVERTVTLPLIIETPPAVEPTSLSALVTEVRVEPASSLPPAVQSLPPETRALPTRALLGLCAIGVMATLIEPLVLGWSDGAPIHMPRSRHAVAGDRTGIDPPNDLAVTGEIRTVGASPRHRIFVDRRVVGQTPATIVVPCGVHRVQIGSAGAVSSLDVPCGGAMDVAP